MTEWPVCRHLLAQHYRVLDYDRTGYGQSEPGPNEPNAENIAKELNSLLEAVKLEPPYVTVGHSWGGITTMEFLATRAPGEIAGMIFVDATSAHYLDVLPFLPAEEHGAAVLRGVDWGQAIGVENATVLSSEEWDAFVKEEASEKHAKQAKLEEAVFLGTGPVLAAKKLLERKPAVLGDAPVAVLRGRTEQDFQQAYDAGVAKGNGTEEQRRKYREVVDGFGEKDVSLQRSFFKLTAGKTEFMQATKSGHNVQMIEPDLIVDAVKWVIANL